MKLVRDKIKPRKGRKYLTLVPKDEERYLTLLCLKLNEEVLEVQTEALHHIPNRDHLTEEMADVIEVLCALADCWGIQMEDVEDVRQKKFEKRGGFETGRVIL